jgi:hypothetical protein
MPWYFASNTCRTEGLRLCTYDELRVACFESIAQDSPEWTADWIDIDTAMTADFDLGACLTSQGSAGVSTGTPYRCCKSLL